MEEQQEPDLIADAATPPLAVAVPCGDVAEQLPPETTTMACIFTPPTTVNAEETTAEATAATAASTASSSGQQSPKWYDTTLMRASSIATLIIFAVGAGIKITPILGFILLIAAIGLSFYYLCVSSILPMYYSRSTSNNNNNNMSSEQQQQQQQQRRNVGMSGANNVENSNNITIDECNNNSSRFEGGDIPNFQYTNEDGRIDDQIKKLEHIQETRSMSLQEEKDIIKEIEALKIQKVELKHQRLAKAM